MKEKISRGINVKIQANYDILNPTEKKIANYILKNANDIEHLTTQELADKTETSKAAVTRFCQRLGYEGFKQFRISAIKEHVQGVKDLHELVNEKDELDIIIKKLCNSNATACSDSSLLIEEKKLEEVAKLILKSERVFLFGDGASAPIIIDFYQKMLRLGIICIHSLDRRLQSMQAVLATEKDVVLAFDLSGASQHTVNTVKVARKKKCKTVGICNSIGSPLMKEAEISLYASARTNSKLTGTFGPRIALLCLVDCLFTGIIKFSNNRFSENLKITMNAIIEDWI